MTTYATSTTHQAPPAGGPPAPPPQNAGGSPTQRTPQPRRAGIFAAAGAFVIAAAATVATAAAIANPITPSLHTVNIVLPPPAEYTSAQIQTAKGAACTAWEQAALATGRASRERASVASNDGVMDARFDARANEKRVSMSQISYLRTQIEPAAPEAVVTPIEEWVASEIDRLHFDNMRDWPAASTALSRGNDLVDVIAPACGLR